MTNPLIIPTPDREGGSPFGSSFIKLYWECPKKWWYTFLAPHPEGGLGLEPLYLSKPFAIGIWVHKWMEAYYKTGQDSSVADSLLSWWIRDYKGPEVYDIVEVEETVEKLIEWYVEYDKFHRVEPIFAGESPMVEQSLSVNLGYNGYTYTARLDGVITDPEDGYNYILEHKTVAVSRFNELIGSSTLDIQLTGQLFLAFHLLPSLQIQGVMLNCLKKGAGRNNTEKIARHKVYRNRLSFEKFRLDMVRTLEGIDLAMRDYNSLVELGMPEYEAARQKFDERGNRNCHWCSYKELCQNPSKAREFSRGFLPRSKKGFEDKV